MDPWIAYQADGRLCRAPASVLDHQRGGMVCLQHVPEDVADKGFPLEDHLHEPCHLELKVFGRVTHRAVPLKEGYAPHAV
jgi:hypothetical protein